MFDAAYTGVFHFHNHAQKYDNQDYAGPHMGDFAYAEATRANCLVLRPDSAGSADIADGSDVAGGEESEQGAHREGGDLI